MNSEGMGKRLANAQEGNDHYNPKLHHSSFDVQRSMFKGITNTEL